MQPRPVEEWIEKGHQRDANLCSAYARPIDERDDDDCFYYFQK